MALRDPSLQRIYHRPGLGGLRARLVRQRHGLPGPVPDVQPHYLAVRLHHPGQPEGHAPGIHADRIEPISDCYRAEAGPQLALDQHVPDGAVAVQHGPAGA